MLNRIKGRYVWACVCSDDGTAERSISPAQYNSLVAASQYITQTAPLNSRGAALPDCYTASFMVLWEATT